MNDFLKEDRNLVPRYGSNINLDIYQFPPTEDREIVRYMQQLIDDDER